MKRRPAVLVVLAVVLSLIGGVAWWRVVEHRPPDEAQRTAVMAAAARATTALMTQRAGDPPVRADVAALLTGRLADEYASQGVDVVLAGAVGQRMTMTARVVGTGVSQLRDDRARVLVFVDLWATPDAADRESPRVPLTRWATMRNVDGQWLLSGLAPIGGTLG